MKSRGTVGAHVHMLRRASWPVWPRNATALTSSDRYSARVRGGGLRRKKDSSTVAVVVNPVEHRTRALANAAISPLQGTYRDHEYVLHGDDIMLIFVMF